MNACRIRRIAIANESDFLIVRCSPDGFVHSDYCRVCSSVVGHVIGSYFQVFGRDEEEYVTELTQNFNVRLIASRNVIDQAFVFEVEAVAVPRGTGSIIEDSLMRNLDAEDLAQYLGGFSGRNGKRNIEGQNQTKDILAVMDSRQLDRRSFRRRVFQFFWLEVIFPVLVVDFKLRTFLLHQLQFGFIQLTKCLDTMRAVIV